MEKFDLIYHNVNSLQLIPSKQICSERFRINHEKCFLVTYSGEYVMNKELEEGIVTLVIKGLSTSNVVTFHEEMYPLYYMQSNIMS